MAIVSAPYGVQPISDQSGTARLARLPTGITSGYATNIFKYQPVSVNPVTGTLQAVTAGNQPIFGVFDGVEYTPLGGRPTVSPFWPAGTIVDLNYDFLVYYWPAWIPGTRWKIQANGSVPQTAMPSQFSLVNLASGNAATGVSTCGVNATPVAAGVQGQFALVEFATDVLNGGQDTPGDPFTDLICTIAYPQVGLGFQPSVG